MFGYPFRIELLLTCYSRVFGCSDGGGKLGLLVVVNFSVIGVHRDSSVLCSRGLRLCGFLLFLGWGKV